MKIALIYATWPVTPFGVNWYKLADALRRAGLTQHLEQAGHHVEEHVLAAAGASAGEFRGAFELSGQIAAACGNAAQDGAFPIVVCGSCSVASLGVAAGLGGRGRTGVLWLDAHPDLNTSETSGSGLLDGMAVATILGECWKHMAQDVAGLRPLSPQDICFFGARDIDPGEAAFMASQRIPIAKDADEAARHLSRCDQIYLHLDMDVHDPREIRASNYAVPDGPTPDQVRDFITKAARNLPVAALSLTSLDPAMPEAAAGIACAIGHIEAVCGYARR